jgi:hypothetical protein
MLLPALLLAPGCAATFGVISGARTTQDYESTPEQTVALEDTTLHAERAELRVTVAKASATGVDLSVEQRAVCPVATLSRETFASTRPPKAGRLIGALLIDLVATGLAAGGVAYAGMQDPDMSPREWQRNTALAAGAGGGVMLIGAGAWLYPSLTAKRNNLRVDYSSDWCSSWTSVFPAHLEALAVDGPTAPAVAPWSFGSFNSGPASAVTGDAPLALTALDTDISARRAQLAPKWLAHEVAPPSGQVDVAYGPSPWSDRGLGGRVHTGNALATRLRPEISQPDISAAGLGRLVWKRGDIAPTPLTVWVDVNTAGAVPGRGMSEVVVTPGQFSLYGDDWRCAALDDITAPAPWSGTSAQEMMTVLDRIQPICPDTVAVTRAAVCRLGAAEATSSAAGTFSIRVEDLSAYDTCPDSPWRATFQSAIDQNIAQQKWSTAYATITTYQAHWGDEWRNAALAKVVPADVRAEAAAATTAPELRWGALNSLSRYGGALPASVFTQLQAIVAGRVAAVLATPDGIGAVDRDWIEGAQALAEALPAGPAAAVRKRVDQVEAALISGTEREISALVADREYVLAGTRAEGLALKFPSGARIAAWAEKKEASLQAQAAAWDAAQAARQAAEERREAARQAAEERREAARQAAEEAAEERREAAEERRHPSRQSDGNSDARYRCETSCSMLGQMAINQGYAQWYVDSEVESCRYRCR